MNNTENLILLKKRVEQNPNDLRIKGNYFWLLHRRVKENLEKKDLHKSILGLNEMGKNLLQSEMANNSIGWNIYKTLKILSTDKDLINKYKNYIPLLTKNLQKINIGLNPQLYSSLFWVLNKLADGSSLWFLEFAKKVELKNFRSSDFEEREYNRKKFNSLVVSVHLKLAKIITGNTLPEQLEYVNWLLPKLEELSDRYPSEIWLIHQRGKMLLQLKKFNEAREMIFKVLKSKQNQFWAWAILGETYLNIDDEKALACFSKGILLGGKPEMLIGIKLLAAKHLFKLGYYSEAKTELTEIVEIRKKNGWKITNEIKALIDNKHIINSEFNKDLLPFYKEKATAIEQILLEQLPEAKGVIVNIHNKKGWAFITFGVNKTARYILTEKDDYKIGDFVSVRVDERMIAGEKKYDVKYIEKIEEIINLDFIKRIKGELIKGKNKDFGFVNNMFIPAYLIKQYKIEDKDFIEALAVAEYNKNKEIAWKLFKIYKIN